ncbi:glucose-6-phosphate isomerase [Mesorhizobium sp. LSJC268A00]|uniref:glucose-6-phosphate isomerase n=1 Tax=Mesorhizobium sp. LSJC265A00 TaxID=1287322 RepID=UPI0003CE212C|nr:glucose-6-phosphate isomerase [Mesorhizobium sp. LSJC269B00]ESX04746.1 glucose-6-phosphate isomerase [Mesorhizobium sp. LSJC268A00]ESX10841.1 glucose-6-phosphate isomerase [Mesorhizobium sp. LSJC265A00]ESX21615.1 glucose-6-phosphate isomerase [Mesorhizobium sp. LSJC255A00]ESX28470.1 glucose-6-phosphate isomerase [Mesorhizobium sp. LSHC440B00]ESX37361.1 glucose-6-phosphate isomerase [Mesorhizobium sp. LSHC432A00]ESX42304.1 glucose-6-phosphate isomerase [Mesorhizobium sp. LSHC440A00]ESX4348
MDHSSFDKQLVALRAARAAASGTMREAFAADPKRFETFSASDGDLLLDWSKCAVDQGTMELLEKLAAAADLEGRRAAMFSGKKINITEDRAVLHTALRNLSGKGVTVDGQDVKADVLSVLDAMGAFADAIRSGKAAGATGKKITDIVNIGIGGSDLGPAMATLALAPYHDGPRAHYVSNIDGAHIHDTLKGLSAETTLFIIASKTFTTVETMTNAETAREWVQKALGKEAVGKHFAAVSTALDLVSKFGIEADRVFGFWDWVGGRYSLWGAIGLPVMIAIGPRNFRAFLDGAHEMDEHFRTAPLQKNLPALLGLVGWWHRVICGYPARAVIPYDQRLSRLPAYLQQLDMESNGKGVTLDGTPVTTPTGPLVWGEPGTNGQHAFFQLLHQGTDSIPVEFLAAAVGHEPDLKHQHDLLLANCLAQSEALMKGRTLDEARAQMLAKGMKPADVDRIAPHRVFSGNRPSVTILYRKLDPRTFGRLIALYEHRVFVEGTLFNINSFDQWGVELGKELATGLLPVVEGKESAAKRDASTAGLVARIQQLRGAQ